GQLAAPQAPGTVVVEPSRVTAGERVAPLSWQFAVPMNMRGGGLPTTLRLGHASDRSLMQFELPLPGGDGEADENGSSGVGRFDGPVLCWIDQDCAARFQDGYLRAQLVRGGQVTRELQLAVALRDEWTSLPVMTIIGVYAERDLLLVAGDQVRIEYWGPVPLRSTEWTGNPLRLHVRYRHFWGGWIPTAWTEVADDRVTGLTIAPLGAPAFVSATAPLDVAAGEPFRIAVVVTDRVGNPQPYTGRVTLSGAVAAEIFLDNQARGEIEARHDLPGTYRVVPAVDLPGVRAVYHYTRAHAGAPPRRRLVGDVHIHTGDGGAQRKFIGSFGPGDHAGLYSSMRDAYRYLEEISGYDFGAVSEHAVRDDQYTPPPAVAADPAFQPGGACAGAGHPIAGLDGWWPHAQAIAREVDGGQSGDFVSFPAYEWHSQHVKVGDVSPLHRVVLYRDFSPADDLPIMPGDVNNLPPPCLVRFLERAGHTSESALVVPHMMLAQNGNIDWDLTYADSELVSREEVEDFHRIGEIFSARSYDQPAAVDLLTGFEGADQSPGRWTYRYGWRDLGAHIGLIGSSDNHSQTPGVDDTLTAGGERYHRHEPAGTAVVLADARDRDGIFDGLRARRTYATSGVRVWLDLSLAGAAMGQAIALAAPAAAGRVELHAGLTIQRVEIWAAPVGVPGAAYQLVHDAAPGAESYAADLAIASPLAPGAPPAEWLYYLRAFLHTPGDAPDHAHDAVWSSPIWIRWSR
ncbi:MAG TPA: DUF3604 domain-containing protein, partial [Kofleriaceae bacterium]|nr:DUF3604 domain-containing protein [Kofleriaceae bacterium]